MCRVCECNFYLGWVWRAKSVAMWGWRGPTEEPCEAPMTRFSVGNRTWGDFREGVRLPFLSILINKAANLGKSTLLSPFYFGSHG